MPIYTYSCLRCDTTPQRIVKIADRDNQKCDNCDQALDRNIDRPGLVWAPTSGKGMN